MEGQKEANTPALNLEQLKARDYIFLLDRSGSMTKTDCPGNKSRWKYMQEETEALVTKATEWDANGVTIAVFNNKWKIYENVNGPEMLTKIWAENEPGGSTDTAGVLEEVLNAYIAGRTTAGSKPITVIVMTDGEPDDRDALKKVIIKTANAIENDDEIGISFVQVGKDGSCSAFLKSLDDDLQGQGAKFDIVDTVTMDEQGDKSVTQILIDAVCD